MPPRGRAPGFPAGAGFKAKLKILDLAPGCLALEKTYGVDLIAQPIEVGFSAQPAENQAAIENTAKQAIGTIVSFKTNQKFGYVTGGKFLPLYPTVFSESMDLSGQSVDGSGVKLYFGTDLKIDGEKAHGIKPLPELSEDEKLKLAGKLAHVYVQTFWAPGWLSENDFGALFVQLAKASASKSGPAVQHSYAMLTLNVFDEMLLKDLYTEFFNFNIGGVGAFQGQEFAQILNLISHTPLALSQDEIVQLLTDYPTLLNSNPYGGVCLATNSEILEKFIDATAGQLQRLTMQKVGWLKQILPLLIPIDGAPAYASAGCITSKITPAIKAKAQALLEKLN